MKLTIGSEAIFFVSLIIAYLYFWRSGNFQALAAEHLSIKTTGFFTLLLMASSGTFVMAEKSHRRNALKSMRVWLGITILLGLIFLAGQGHEYYKLVNEHVTVSHSEFGSSFYTLTGFHGLHVLIGLIVLSVALLLADQEQVQHNKSTVISTIGIYWHFVDVVWLFVFSTVYVLPYII